MTATETAQGLRRAALVIEMPAAVNDADARRVLDLLNRTARLYGCDVHRPRPCELREVGLRPA